MEVPRRLGNAHELDTDRPHDDPGRGVDPEGQTALRNLARMERGLLLYLRQEGRGIGLRNKVRAYQLQDKGLDTVEANRALGFRDDERDYGVAAHMIASLNVKSVRLMTNNPNKIQQLEQHVSRKRPQSGTPVRRIDGAYGDRNLVCACPAPEAFEA